MLSVCFCAEVFVLGSCYSLPIWFGVDSTFWRRPILCFDSILCVSGIFSYYVGWSVDIKALILMFVLLCITVYLLRLSVAVGCCVKKVVLAGVGDLAVA